MSLSPLFFTDTHPPKSFDLRRVNVSGPALHHPHDSLYWACKPFRRRSRFSQGPDRQDVSDAKGVTNMGTSKSMAYTPRMDKHWQSCTALVETQRQPIIYYAICWLGATLPHEWPAKCTAATIQVDTGTSYQDLVVSCHANVNVNLAWPFSTS